MLKYCPLYTSTEVIRRIEMRRLIGGVVVLFMFLGMSVASAAPITGSIDSDTGGGMYGTAAWDDGNAELDWSVSFSGGLWTYVYDFDVTAKAISHAIFQVSETFTSSNVKSGTTSGWLLDTWGTQGNSNPGIPSNLFGLKFAGNDTTGDFTIVTDRAPMWGSFYAKDGKDGGNDVFAYNVNFGGTSSASIYGQAPYGFVLVPDTKDGDNHQIPEPGSFALLGLATMGLAFVRKKIFEVT